MSIGEQGNKSYFFPPLPVSPFPDFGILSTVVVLGRRSASLTGMNSPVLESLPSGNVFDPLLIVVLGLVDNWALVMIE